jgi:hypothetical protein
VKFQGWGKHAYRCAAHECRFDGCGSSVVDGAVKEVTIHFEDEKGMSLRLRMSLEEAQALSTQLSRMVEMK